MKTPPTHLRSSTKRWWRSVVSGWQLDDHHLHLLKLACEALDRAEQAREEIEKGGAVVKDRFNQLCPSPWVAIERDSRLAFARLLRELDLDGEPMQESRPPALRSNRPLTALRAVQASDAA
jgi:phage terminase small subunit